MRLVVRSPLSRLSGDSNLHIGWVHPRHCNEAVFCLDRLRRTVIESARHVIAELPYVSRDMTTWHGSNRRIVQPHLCEENKWAIGIKVQQINVEKYRPTHAVPSLCVLSLRG